MARPQAANFDQRQNFILDEAAKLIASNGFHGSSVGDLAKQCNISKSLIYHYFTSKEAILFAVMENYTKDLLNTVEVAAKKGENISKTFQETVKSLLDNYKSAGPKHRVLLQELDKLSPPHRKSIIANEDKIKNIIKGQIAKFNPDIPANDPKNTALTMLFLGMVNWTHTWFNQDGKVSRSELANMAAVIFENGVRSLSETP
jgi:AcrR family transcriptional regulator